jgi:hypothetical protein
MWRIGGRPLGIITVAVVVLLDAALSFIAAYTTIVSDALDSTAAVLLVLVGVIMVIKAYGLWSYHRAAWLSVQVLAGLGIVVDATELVRGHTEDGWWLSLAWHLITLVYLNLPRIRALYAHRSAM